MQTCYDDHPHIFKALGKALEYSSGDFKNKDVVYDIVGDPEIELVVECMGGLEPAHTFISGSPTMSS